MWRFWIPRVLRQQFHGPRASAGVCVEEEKAEHEVEKHFNESVNSCHGNKELDTSSLCVQSSGSQGPEVKGQKGWAHHERGNWWNRHCQKDGAHHEQGDWSKRHEQGNWWKHRCQKGGAHHEQGDWSKRHCQKGGAHHEQGDWSKHCQKGGAHHEQVDWSKHHCHKGGAHHEWGDWWKHHCQKGGAHHEQGDWSKRHCHKGFWSHFCGFHHTLDAVTWGAAVVLGLQLSRRPNLHNYFEGRKSQDKHRQWKGLLFRMAFAMPPDASLSVRRSIVQQEDAESTSGKVQKKAKDKEPTKATEDTKTLDDVMQDFETSCRQYAAVGSSVQGVYAAEQGQMLAAVEHLKLASQLGHAPAYYNLALCHQMGLGVKKDQQQAASYYRMAANSGHVQAVFNLALMTLRGEGGLVKDKVKAVKLLTKAAQGGLAQAQTYLGVYYTEDDDNQQNFEQAASFFQAAASQNDAEGQYFLGICFENGWGVESSDEEAARLYSAAAELEHDGAMYNLAAFHEYGLGGMMCDEKEAMSLYRRSAQLGNDNAKFRLEEVEAKEAVSQWSEQNAAKDVVQSPGLRRSPHASSPTLTDYVRENIAGIWVGGLADWSSFQTIDTSSAGDDSPVTFTIGDGHAPQDSYTADQQSLVAEGSYSFLTLPQVHLPHSCVASMQRTSTMPELRTVSCQ